MHSLGLKLWSINKNYIDEALRLYEKSIYQYIELYVVPDSYEKYIDLWKTLDIPFIIHAPHFEGGMNLASKKNRRANIYLIEEALRFSDSLNVDTIIFHPGVEGTIEETIDQLKSIHDTRIVIENKPYKALFDELICIGSSPDEIQEIENEANVGFCLDVGHAICSANSHSECPLDYIEMFIELNPRLIHLTDGEYQSEHDHHYNLGKGSFPLSEIIKKFEKKFKITIESKKKSMDTLEDFVEDVKYFDSLWEYLKNNNNHCLAKQNNDER